MSVASSLCAIFSLDFSRVLFVLLLLFCPTFLGREILKKLTENKAVIMRIGNGKSIARKLMFDSAKKKTRKRGQHNCKYKMNNVETVGT